LFSRQYVQYAIISCSSSSYKVCAPRMWQHTVMTGIQPRGFFMSYRTVCWFHAGLLVPLNKPISGQKHKHTHTHTQNHLTTLCPGLLRWASARKHSAIRTHPDHHTSLINFLHLLRSIASSSFNLRAWPFSTTSFQGLVTEMIQATGDTGTQWILDLCKK